MSLTFLSPRAQCAHFVIVLKEDRQSSYNVTLWCIHITIVAVETHSVCWDTHYCQLYNSIDCFTAMLLWQIYVAGKNKTYSPFHVKCACACAHTHFVANEAGNFIVSFLSRQVTSQMWMIGQLWVTMRYVHTCDFLSPYLSVLNEQVTYMGKVLCMHVILSWFWSFLIRNIKICTVCAVVTFVYKAWDYDCSLFLSSGTSGTWSISFFPHGLTASSGPRLPYIVEVLDHTQTPRLIGLFWTSEQPVAEMSACWNWIELN